MDKQFDELSKSLAEGVTRKEALKKFSIGLAGILLAAVGLSGARQALAQKPVHYHCDCKLLPTYGCTTVACEAYCYSKCNHRVAVHGIR